MTARPERNFEGHRRRDYRRPERGSSWMSLRSRSSGERSPRRYRAELDSPRRHSRMRREEKVNDGIESSEYLYRRPYKRVHTSESFPQMPEPVYSSRRTRESVNSKRSSFEHWAFRLSLNDGLSGGSSGADNGLSEEEKEHFRVSRVDRKKDFVHIERIGGKPINVLQGLELHTQVFNAEEQKQIVECIYEFQRMGQKGMLRVVKFPTLLGAFTFPFGFQNDFHVTLATLQDKNGNPPGIKRDEEVDPLPSLFKKIIKRMVRWDVLPPSCIPDSCIVNIYKEGDCIPPHIDHHDFVRPFCSLSLLTECNIVLGSTLQPVSPGEFSGPVSIPLPVGSVLILNGNGADIAQHCIPSVPAKRISITFRKMDDGKLPYKFSQDPELLGIRPLIYSPLNKSPVEHDEYGKRLWGSARKSKARRGLTLD
ncbi:RNA demethylase ALKBH5 [Morella rubra]|uniref:RNA demethylase ALKBH5 n=1 Tax=Morella rubra TaxID=262757 RepID=A0A6A1V594_9ROSI|nr:RNA demethylase ALKBH5 [Morella rubra]